MGSKRKKCRHCNLYRHGPDREPDEEHCWCASPQAMQRLREAAALLPNWRFRIDPRWGGRLLLAPKGSPKDPDGSPLEVGDWADFDHQHQAPLKYKKNKPTLPWYAWWSEDPLVEERDLFSNPGHFIVWGNTPQEAVRKVRDRIERVAKYYAKLAPTKGEA